MAWCRPASGVDIFRSLAFGVSVLADLAVCDGRLSWQAPVPPADSSERLRLSPAWRDGCQNDPAIRMNYACCVSFLMGGLDRSRRSL